MNTRLVAYSICQPGQKGDGKQNQPANSAKAHRVSLFAIQHGWGYTVVKPQLAVPESNCGGGILQVCLIMGAYHNGGDEASHGQPAHPDLCEGLESEDSLFCRQTDSRRELHRSQSV